MYYELDNVLDYLGNEVEKNYLFEMKGNVFSIAKDDLKYGKIINIKCITKDDSSLEFERIDGIAWHEDMLDITVGNKTFVFKEIK